MIDTRQQLIRIIEQHLKASGQSRTAFGYLSVGDPGFITKLERGRVPREKMIERVKAFIEGMKL